MTITNLKLTKNVQIVKKKGFIIGYCIVVVLVEWFQHLNIMHFFWQNLQCFPISLTFFIIRFFPDAGAGKVKKFLNKKVGLI